MSAFVLKMIAIVAMVIDHVEKVFGFQFSGLFFGDYVAAGHFQQAMTCVGRLTFPIMAFFIAEGCKKTRNAGKYVVRLLVVAVISEPIFDLAFDILNYNIIGNPENFSGYTFLSFSSQNVIFTLLFSCLACTVYEHLKGKHKVLAFGGAAAFAVLAELLHTEYGFLGVTLIFAVYALPTRKQQLIGMSVILTLFYLVYIPWGGYGRYPIQWLSSLVSVALLALYNGQRGRKSKYFFYIFYPAHLLVLVLLREVIFRW